MISILSLAEHGKELFELLGTPCALLVAAFVIYKDTCARRADTLIAITNRHTNLWMYYDSQPELKGLFEERRDMKTHPLTDKETRFANYLFLHLRASFGAEKAGTHVMPEQVAADWGKILAHPAMTAAWEKMKEFHDSEFVALVETYRRPL